LEVVHLMSRRAIMAVAVAALGWLCISCGGTAPGLSSVTGKVVCNGQPAAGAVVYLHRRSGEPPPPPEAANVIPTATAGDDGSFTVESHPLGPGAAPGKYAVLVKWPEESTTGQSDVAGRTKTATVQGKKVTVVKADKLEGVPGDRLKGRYMDEKKPLLEAEIKPGSNDLGTLELVMSK
jgi:hypothetical protein